LAENSDLLMLPSRILSTLEDYEQALYDSAMDIFAEAAREFQSQETWDNSVPLEEGNLLASICSICGGELALKCLALTESGYCDAYDNCSKCGAEFRFKWDVEQEAWANEGTLVERSIVG